MANIDHAEAQAENTHYGKMAHISINMRDIKICKKHHVLKTNSNIHIYSDI